MPKETLYQTIKIKKTVLNLVKENKAVTLVPVGAFIERAIMNQLEIEKKSKKR